MKPIEPGCKCVIVNAIGGEGNGVIVTVLKYIGDVPNWTHGSVWEIDTELPTTQGTRVSMAPEYNLKRIDDYDGNEKVEWDECVWKPSMEGV